MLRIDVSNVRIVGKNLIGNLEYLPYHMFVDDYIFGDGDVLVDTGKECYIDMVEDKYWELAYEL